MDKMIVEFLNLEKIFSLHGYNLYLVGGTVRDYLLGLELTDMDAVTDATPDEVKAFLEGVDFTFSRMGAMRYKSHGVKFDITTLREENSYVDSRHPNSIKFVKDLKIDVIRRDFTVNAMYLDKNLEVIDFVNGKQDLNNKILKMVGNPDIRLKEDPLRIIRAIRFALDLEFDIDEELAESMLRNIDLLKKLNPDKISADIKKIKSNNIERKNELFNRFGITL